MSEILETSVDKLPADLRGLIADKLSSEEVVIHCLLCRKSIKLPIVGEQVSLNGLVITDYKLIFTQKGQSPFELPERDSRKDIHILGLERLRDIKLHRRPVLFSASQTKVYIDYGMRTVPNYQGDTSDPDPLEIDFTGHEALAEKFVQILSKATADAFIRVRKPTASKQGVPDIADQLAKLADLHARKTISDDEFETAKRKLLS